MLVLGSHVALSGDEMYLGSVKEALSYNATTMMVYTGAPQNTIRKPLSSMRIEEAQALMKEKGIDIKNVVVHAPYIINLCNPDSERRAFAVEFLTKEVERTEAMGVTQMVLHPGSAVGGDREQAAKWISEGLNQIIANTPNASVRIALETMAGKGNEMGKTFEELRDIIAGVDNKSRVSVCFDTCHTHDAGYDVKNDFDSVIKHFDEVVGKEKISVIHVNDSKNEIGAHKDRHENIGFGYLGFDALIHIIYHKDFQNIPKILETPYVEEKAPYKFEIEMIKQKAFNASLKDLVKNSVE
ncbi:deoxyribonuclease IV [Acholeplasma equirhinis]|uniref:deoxyribonuclease IV n=1 Tax=Acholeplasma equirhinis TaxID=555393 RepID=UPI00197A9AE1|nr:deoxyribonuclease IV [Acholeplasma equirhinis]MBN3490216.1 deoxyribonuclease IV [Acholeplasma equirhinis]